MENFIVLNNGMCIFGITPNQRYKVLGCTTDDCVFVKNNSGEIISIHPDYYHFSKAGKGWKSIKVNTKYTADGLTWTVVEVNDEGIFLECENLAINIDITGNTVWLYKILKDGTYAQGDNCISFEEMEMVQTIKKMGVF
jgi:hypothetical protein